MLTSRGSRFLMFSGTLLALTLAGPLIAETALSDQGITLPHASTIVLIALALLIWFSWEWLWFAFSARITVRRLQVQRVIEDERGKVESLWPGVPFTVQVRVTLPGGTGTPYVVLTDRIPFGATVIDGSERFEGSLSPDSSVEWEYRIRVTGIGGTRFEGITLQMADLQGFFYFTTFLSTARTYRVLPSLLDRGVRGGTVKRHNLLLPPGIHRHRRPGSGTELLDLRDYRPGDPPKTIAWKVSARRDRLITKEFESEVPVRCTLFVDISSSVRVGAPGQNALAKLAEIAAAVARTASDNRDLTGLCHFDENGCTFVRPGRGGRHLVRLLNVLADMAAAPPAASHAAANELLPTAYGLAQEVYPELLSREINRSPFWLAWLWPPPTFVIHRPRLSDYVYRWLPFILPAYTLMAVGLFAVVTYILLLVLVEADAPGGAVLGALLVCLIGFALAILRLPAAMFFPHKRRRLQWRKRLAAVLSVKYNLAPGGLAMLLEDDDRFGYYVQRFLADHHIPYPAPLYDRQGRYLFAAPGKAGILSSALLRRCKKPRQ